MKKTIWTIIVIIVLILIVWAIAASDDETTTEDGTPATRTVLVDRAQQAGLEVTEDSLLVDLAEQDDSGISGVAVLTELDNNQTRVAAWLDDTAGNSRPIHIHAGTCSNLGDVVHPLSDVVDDFSNSTVAVTFGILEADAPLAINAHESAEAIQNNIACGNIDFDQADAGTSDDDEEEDADTGTTTEEGDDDDEEDTDADTEATATIRYTDSGFVPSELVVARGTTVRFVNESSGSMWVASANHPTHEILPAFDQLTSVATGVDYEFTFAQEGTWNFHNHVSANHTGRVVVQ